MKRLRCNGSGTERKKPNQERKPCYCCQGTGVEPKEETRLSQAVRERPRKTDVEIEYDGGTLALFRPLTDEAMAWLDRMEKLTDGTWWFGNALAVPHRYVIELAEALRDAGLVVRRA